MSDYIGPKLKRRLHILLWTITTMVAASYWVSFTNNSNELEIFIAALVCSVGILSAWICSFVLDPISEKFIVGKLLLLSILAYIPLGRGLWALQALVVSWVNFWLIGLSFVFALLLLVGLAGKILKLGKSEIMTHIFLGMFMIPIPMALIYFVNINFDNHSPQVFKSTVLNKEDRFLGKCSTLSLQFSGWDDKRIPNKINFSTSYYCTEIPDPDYFYAKSISEEASALLYPGKLGISWVRFE